MGWISNIECEKKFTRCINLHFFLVTLVISIVTNVTSVGHLPKDKSGIQLSIFEYLQYRTFEEIHFDVQQTKKDYLIFVL